MLWEKEKTLKGIAHKMSSDPETIKDLMQEMRLYLWEHRNSKHTDSYLLQRAMREARDHTIRSNNLRPVEFLPEISVNPEKEIQFGIDMANMKTKLNDREQNILNMLELGLKRFEIADIFHVDGKIITRNKKRIAKKIKFAF